MTSTTTRRLLPGLLLVAALALAPSAGAATDPVGQWPLRPVPEVVAGFDPPASIWGAGHRGVDLAGAAGQPVRAALPGTVDFVGRVAGRPVVVVGHGPTRTTYEPVEGSLQRGDRVLAGQVIGNLGVVGSHCFPRACLHWGWLREETYLDPLRLLGGGPVRLLPLTGLTSLAPPSRPGRLGGLRAPAEAWTPLLRLVEDWW